MAQAATKTTTAKPQSATAERSGANPTQVQPGQGANLPAKTPPKSVLFDMSDRYGMEPAAFEATLRATAFPGQGSREHFAAFLLVAKEYDLNPLLKEIYAFPTRGGGIQPIVSIDGWSNLINSNPAFDGMEFEDKFDGTNLVAITCRMFRKDRSHPIEATEYMAECKRATDTWKQWPRRMLRHKAMIQAARYAFGFAGIVDPDEAERFAAENARDITPRARPANTAAAFDEFAKVGRSTDDDTAAVGGDDPDNNGTDEFNDAASQPDGKPEGEQAPQGDLLDEDTAGQASGEGDAPRLPPGQYVYEGEAEPQETPDKAAWPMHRLPKTAAEYVTYGDKFGAEATAPDKLTLWWNSADQKALRVSCGMKDDRTRYDLILKNTRDRIEALKKPD